MNTNDADLIQRILDGDEGAFTALVNKYQKPVHALVWRKIGDFHTAEEITQDVFLKVYKRLSTLKRPDHFPGWLYVIATRHCIAWLRKKQLPTKSLDAMSTAELEEICYAKYETDRDEEATIEHRREIVKRLLQKLPESERTVVTLFYLAEMTSEEVSAFLGVSSNTIRSRLHRARERLEKEEAIIQEVVDNFQISPYLTDNIIREVARTKPTSPSVSRPWVPWALSFSSMFLVILMMGFGPQTLSRFQHPYSLNATSEMTVELIDAPIVLELERKSDALTRFGRTDIPGKNSRSGFQAEPLHIAAAQADETDLPAAKREWIQTQGPGGVSSAGLFLTSDQVLYAITKTGLYQLTETADAWTLVSASGPNREFERVMAERDDTFYLLTANELLVSNDDGRTWNSLGTRPQGRAVALIITDIAMYLVLQTEVFRSEDSGNQWQPIGKRLRTDNIPARFKLKFHIWDALAVDNTLFVGTSQGLFRFTDNWEKLPVSVPHGIFSLAAAKDRLYVGTIANPVPHAAVLYSTDLGDSWIDITPNTREHPTKIIAAVEVVPVRDTLMLKGSRGVLLSYDGGETWIDPNPGPHTFGGFPVLSLDENTFFGAFPIVALDENTFYGTESGRIKRSTDGGTTWHPFMTGMVKSHVPSLVALKNVLYAPTPEEMLKSVDGGETWESLGLNTNVDVSLEGQQTKVVTADGVLYASTSELDDVTLYRLSDAGDLLITLEGVPDFEEGTLHEERRFEEIMKARRNDGDANKFRELLRVNHERVIEEWKTNGTLACTDDTVFMEYRHKLFRWRHVETAWHDTGLEDIEGISPIEGKGFTLAVSGNTVYAGKREGDLFLSVDDGDTWRDVTENLVFPFEYFKEILFAGSTVYVLTDMGVMSSRDGETWNVPTDADGKRLFIDRIAVDGTMAYGVSDSGVYQIDNQTNTWEQIAPELPHTATSFAVDGNTFYIGTKQNGVLRFQREGR